ncbi:ABC transporter substrate-binding protein [Mesorhizobium sp. C277A]|uniref:ABC transporter substrate-binding protein n=3 Tax=Mesorhizobium TaxID=68287 RepID=UPI0003CF115D|nr:MULTISPECIES: ABC transporter substrate-binding protein [unclassified Mesorhizobium]ESW68140.1 ABC transporter substrate-binding protein [Mesorhizobium sp. LSJC277A00]ESX25051.1 ABC transporter substrate-binding protein [Mesorhizobium sp. LSJC264A00]
MIARALRAFTLLAAILLCVDQAARAAEGSSAFFPSPQPEKDRLSIHAATDLVAMEPLIRDFQSVFPNVAVDYVEYVTNDLQKSASEACRTGAVLGDILLSPSVDQLVKLANDGCAAPHVSAETAHVADWANWRDEVFGFTYEPAVFVYNARLVPSGDVPRTHIELADLLRRRLDFYRGRVGTFDIRLSGIGYLLAFSDARQTTAVYGRLLESMSRAETVVRCCTAETLQDVANGTLYIGYNMIGSYAYAAARDNSDLRVVVPRDYALILSRGALIPKTAPSMALAKRFLDYLLSARGQKVARESSFFFAENGQLPDGADGPETLGESGIARAIRIGPALLAVQDEALRRRFIEDWSKSMIGAQGQRP